MMRDLATIATGAVVGTVAVRWAEASGALDPVLPGDSENKGGHI